MARARGHSARSRRRLRSDASARAEPRRRRYRVPAAVPAAVTEAPRISGGEILRGALRPLAPDLLRRDELLHREVPAPWWGRSGPCRWARCGDRGGPSMYSPSFSVSLASSPGGRLAPEGALGCGGLLGDLPPWTPPGALAERAGAARGPWPPAPSRREQPIRPFRGLPDPASRARERGEAMAAPPSAAETDSSATRRTRTARSLAKASVLARIFIVEIHHTKPDRTPHHPLSNDIGRKIPESWSGDRPRITWRSRADQQPATARWRCPEAGPGGRPRQR